MTFLRINLPNFMQYHHSPLSWYHLGKWHSQKRYSGNGILPRSPSTTPLVCSRKSEDIWNMVDTVWLWKHRRLGRVLRNEGLLQEITGKAYREKKRLQRGLCFVAYFLGNATIKELWKSANICRSYERVYSGTVFWLPVYVWYAQACSQLQIWGSSILSPSLP